MNKRIAEALVECHYAKEFKLNEITGQWMVSHQANSINEDYDLYYPVCFDQDTLEGRRQADALEDWLTLNHYPLWNRSELDAESPEKPYSENGAFWYQHRRNKLKWCFEQLEKDNGQT